MGADGKKKVNPGSFSYSLSKVAEPPVFPAKYKWPTFAFRYLSLSFLTFFQLFFIKIPQNERPCGLLLCAGGKGALD